MSKLLGVPSRRRFIQLGAAATATGLFAPSIARAAARKIKIGYVGPLSTSPTG
ncbi:MAG: twin-arginine translocation signal domain-containing protein [Maritimibacter sp.]